MRDEMNRNRARVAVMLERAMAPSLPPAASDDAATDSGSSSTSSSTRHSNAHDRDHHLVHLEGFSRDDRDAAYTELCRLASSILSARNKGEVLVRIDQAKAGVILGGGEWCAAIMALEPSSHQSSNSRRGMKKLVTRAFLITHAGCMVHWGRVRARKTSSPSSCCNSSAVTMHTFHATKLNSQWAARELFNDCL